MTNTQQQFGAGVFASCDLKLLGSHMPLPRVELPMRTLDVPPEPIENNWYGDRCIHRMNSSYIHITYQPGIHAISHTQKSQKVIVRQVNYGVYWGYRDFF